MTLLEAIRKERELIGRTLVNTDNAPVITAGILRELYNSYGRIIRTMEREYGEGEHDSLTTDEMQLLLKKIKNGEITLD